LKGKGNVLSTWLLHASSGRWVFDSGASHHLNHSNELQPSKFDCSISYIVIGDSTHLDVLGSGTVQFDEGCINDVLLVPDIYANLLSIYQIFHSGDGNTIVFSPNDVVILELQNPNIVVSSRKVYHSSRLYKFASFEPFSASSFISHANSLSRIWHEIFGHLK
jgi:hypothetical protein